MVSCIIAVESPLVLSVLLLVILLRALVEVLNFLQQLEGRILD